MNNDVARIDQHPVARGKSVHRTRSIARLFQPPRQMFGDRTHMPLRPAIGDDNGIGQRRAAFEVDRYDVFRLVVVEGNQNAGE